MSKTTIECLNSDNVYDMENAPDNVIKGMYEMCCQEYVRRLCKLWEVNSDEVWWVSDKIGSQLCIADAPWGIDMDEIIYIVEHQVSNADFMQWWDFVESEIHDGREYPRINFASWFENNCRPKDLEK